MWVRLDWLRLVLFAVVTVGLAWLWAWATGPDPSEVDPPDDMVPVYEFVWLLIWASGIGAFLLSEVLVARWQSRTRG